MRLGLAHLPAADRALLPVALMAGRAAHTEASIHSPLAFLEPAGGEAPPPAAADPELAVTLVLVAADETTFTSSYIGTHDALFAWMPHDDVVAFSPAIPAQDLWTLVQDQLLASQEGTLPVTTTALRCTMLRLRGDRVVNAVTLDFDPATDDVARAAEHLARAAADLDEPAQEPSVTLRPQAPGPDDGDDDEPGDWDVVGSVTGSVEADASWLDALRAEADVEVTVARDGDVTLVAGGPLGAVTLRELPDGAVEVREARSGLLAGALAVAAGDGLVGGAGDRALALSDPDDPEYHPDDPPELAISVVAIGETALAAEQLVLVELDDGWYRLIEGAEDGPNEKPVLRGCSERDLLQELASAVVRSVSEALPGSSPT